MTGFIELYNFPETSSLSQLKAWIRNATALLKTSKKEQKNDKQQSKLNLSPAPGGF
jgi:hypothetical protein